MMRALAPTVTGIFAGLARLACSGRRQARQALVIELEQQPGRHMRHVG